MCEFMTQYDPLIPLNPCSIHRLKCRIQEYLRLLDSSFFAHWTYLFLTFHLYIHVYLHKFQLYTVLFSLWKIELITFTVNIFIDFQMKILAAGMNSIHFHTKGLCQMTWHPETSGFYRYLILLYLLCCEFIFVLIFVKPV